jgi:hypothetical protein
MTKEAHTFFFIFMSSCPEMSFRAQKREKVMAKKHFSDKNYHSLKKLFLPWS